MLVALQRYRPLALAAVNDANRLAPVMGKSQIESHRQSSKPGIFKDQISNQMSNLNSLIAKSRFHWSVKIMCHLVDQN